MEATINSIPIGILYAKYQEIGSVWRTGEYFGVSGPSVQRRLRKAGLIKPTKVVYGRKQRVKQQFWDFNIA